MSSKKKPLNVVNGECDLNVPPDLGACDKDCEPEECCETPCVGCLVVLRSGGPAMTVTAVTCCDRVQTEWFGEAGELNSGEWPAEALTVVDCAA